MWQPITVKKDSKKGSFNEVKLELCLSVLFVCMVAVPTLVDWFPDAPDLVSDLYFSTVFFLWSWDLFGNLYCMLCLYTLAF